MTTTPLRRRHSRTRPKIDPVIMVTSWVLVTVVLVAIFAPALANAPLGVGNLDDRLMPPSAEHPFGTDDVGRDVFSQAFYGLRTSLWIAGLATLISAALGTILGALAGWFGGRIDAAVSFLIDIQASIPAFILALGTVVFFNGSITALVLVLSLQGWERIARIVRAQTMSIRQSGYVASAVSLGVKPLAILGRHVLPGVIGPLAVQVTLALPTKIVIESSLSFLGLGIQPPETSLGQMIGAGREYLASAGWIALFPGLLIIVIGVAIGLLGDRLQDRMIDRE